MAKEIIPNTNIKVPITDEMKIRAYQRTLKFIPNNYSFMKGERVFIGYLGEEVFKTYYGERASYVDSYSYDFLLDNVLKVDVKTKARSTYPLENYECSLPVYQESFQNPHVYFFVSITNIYKSFTLQSDFHAYILGYLTYVDVAEKRNIYKIDKGSVDLSNGVEYKLDVYNIKIKDLRKLEWYKG